MKQRILLISALLLVGVTALAQPNLDDPRSAKTVYMQDFEQSWEEFTTTVIDQIDQIQYYTKSGTSNGNAFKPWEDPEWQKGPIRTDTIIEIYQGSMVVCDPLENQNGSEVWGDDNPSSVAIVQHNDDDIYQFEQFGVADGGGSSYFQFTSDTVYRMNYYNSYSYSNLLAARYRRNLNIHLMPGNIEDNSSYRLTFYVKAKTLPGHENFVATPTVYADLLRGYHHSEKPFSMGYVANSAEHPYEYNKTFEYTKNDFYADKDWDNWEKVTFMTYYTNDSIAENYFFADGYWWAEDTWTWKQGSEGNPYPYDLNYIVQPDKYYIRLGFPADYTVYSVDNISLTNSWIAGCDYYSDMMRIDFGYQTNIAQLVAEEKARTNMDYLQLDNECLTVWILRKDSDENDPSNWFQMPLRSVEYHADGYMYAFTAFYQLEGEDYSFKFGDYGKVLVSFQNPQDDPRLTLKYTDTPFPKGDDMEWIQNGKVVPDFVNEVATHNPSPLVWRGVYSILDIPPVIQKAPYEEGSFGLDQSIRQLSFQFSREIALNNLLAYVGDEEWYTEWDDNTSSLVITRPAEYTSPLAGEYEINIVNIQGIGTGYGENVTLRYHFGSFERNPDVFYKTTDWKNEVAGSYRPYPTSIYIHSGQDPFMKGDGSDSRGKCGLYEMNDVGQYNCGLYLSNRVSGNTGNLYSIETLNKGDYKLSFRACGWGSNSHKLVVKLYAKPEGELIDGNENGFAVLEAVADKVEIGRQERWESNISSPGDWPDGSLDLSYNFFIPSDGDYVIEFYTDGSNSYYGVFFSNYSIRGYSDMSQLYTVPLFESIEKAIALSAVAEADSWKYGGYELDQLEDKIDYYANVFTSTAPSEWTAAKINLDTYAKWVTERMDMVDALQNKVDEAVQKIDELTSDYKQLSAAMLLQAQIDTAMTINKPEKTGAEIETLTIRIDASIEALDNRLDKNNRLNSLISDARLYFKDERKRPDYEEYQTLADALNLAEAFDAICASDERVDEVIRMLTDATYSYAGRVSGWLGQTMRIKYLRELAQELECEVASDRTLNNIVDSIQTDNDEIAAIYKAAIKYEIYNLIADDYDLLDSGFDVTPFIKNFNLYATINSPIADYSYTYLSSSNELLGVNNPGSSIMKIKYQYGQEELDKNIWVLMYDYEYDDVFPGWTVRSIRKSGYLTYGNMVAPDPTIDDKFRYLSRDITVFDGALAMDWNSSAELKTKVVDLPAGYYSLGVELPVLNASTSNITSLSATSYLNGEEDVRTAQATTSNKKYLWVDSIPVGLDGEMDIDLLLKSGSGFSKADNFELIYLGPLSVINYPNEAYVAKAELDALLQAFTEEPTEVYHDIYMSSASADAGSQVVIPVRLENSSTITAFSLDVVLPSGISFVSAQLNSSRINCHSLSTNVTNNWSSSTVSLACLSMNNNPLYYNDGDVVYLTLQLSDDLEGNYTISFTNKEMVSPDNTVYNPSNSAYTLTVTVPYEPGDVNDDGRISIADAVGVVSFIINSNTNGLNRRAADANLDGTIDVADAVWVVNRVIRKSYAPKRGSVRSDVTSRMVFDDVEASALMSLPVRIYGMPNEITAVQLDMKLPDGVLVSGMTTDDNHMTFSCRLENGGYRVVCLSLNNNTFAGSGEAALSLELSTDGSFAGGEFRVDNAMMVLPDGRKINVETAVGRLANNDETGIKGINVDSDANMYDLQGRQIDRANGIYIRDGKKQIQMK